MCRLLFSNIKRPSLRLQKLVFSISTYLGWNILAALLVGGLVGGLLFIDALLLVDGSALLVGNLTVDLVALLLVHCKKYTHTLKNRLTLFLPFFQCNLELVKGAGYFGHMAIKYFQLFGNG